MRPWILAAMLIVPALLLRAEGVEDRLLEGEILEVSKGDLKKAMAIYRAIHADEKAPEPARARALLYLARCQRKVGEIEAARKTLDDLVKAHAKEEEVIRQARSFLRELESGKAESPRFDWLREMEKSPEVQAKAFDLAMDLALNPTSGEHERAMRQLRALGTLSAPVLERVIETSRDSTQRLSIAILLAQMGMYDRLPVIFEADVSVRSSLHFTFQFLLAGIPDLDERARKDFLAAVERAPEGVKRDLVRQLCLLAGAKEGDIETLLRGLEGGIERWEALAIGRALTRIAGRDPSAARALAARIVDPACPAKARETYFNILRESSPVNLGVEQYVAQVETLEKDQDKLLGDLPEDRKFEILLRLAGGPARDAVTQLFWSRGLKEPPHSDARWAPVLRAVKDWKGLHWLAELEDEAIPDLVEFLRDRATIAPEYVSCNPRGLCQHVDSWYQGGPSSAFVAAMTGLLDVDDPVTLAIALETLSLGKPEGVAPAFPTIERLAREAADDRVREVALFALLKVFGKDPEKGPAAVRILFDEFRRRAAAGDIPGSYARSPLFGVARLGFAAMQRPESRFTDTLDWVTNKNNLDETTPMALYPAMLRAANAEGGAAFERWFAARVSLGNLYPALVAPVLESITSPELMAPVAEKLLAGLPRPGKEQSLDDRVAAFLRRVAAEPAAPLELRLKVFQRGGEAAWTWFDWPAFLKGEDPLVDELAGGLFGSSWFEGRGEEEERAVLETALASPRPRVRRAALQRFDPGRKDAAEILERALADPDFAVRSKALEHLAGINRADIAPVFHDLLASPHADVRLGIIEALIRFADPKSIEPIVKLLDDPDVKVRAKALEAVKEIKKTLEERDEWKAWARGAAKPAKEATKD